MAPERRRSARDYEQALRRQELATGRALVAALPTEGSPGTRELAAARRVLTQALFELRRLGRELDEQIESLRSRPGQGRPAPSRGGGPGELDRFQAVRDAVEEIAERWEGRRDQLGAELDRRQPHRRQGQEQRRPAGDGRGQGRGPGQSGQGQGPGQPRGRRTGQPQSGQGGQPRGGRDRDRGERRGEGRGRGGVGDRDGVSGRGAAAPARPERPRSPRSRRSPG
ncbi:MAG TPA: hypothetical protein VG846_05695 [Actinomycetota bacterium]|nr:hypothetical protein [Actinomycetota bacterium]